MSVSRSSDIAELAEIARQQLPRHIAIIMDGNGRWARQRGLPRMKGIARAPPAFDASPKSAPAGHPTGYALLPFERELEATGRRVGVPPAPAPAISDRRAAADHGRNLRVCWIGRREGLPDEALRELDETVHLSGKNTGLCVCLAINYGGRAELVNAVRRVATEAVQGTLDPTSLDEEAISDRLYTAGMPEPDLLIRTAGEMRVSNFLLWQISYAEIWVTDVCWPDFDQAQLHSALAATPPASGGSEG